MSDGAYTPNSMEPAGAVSDADGVGVADHGSP